MKITIEARDLDKMFRAAAYKFCRRLGLEVSIDSLEVTVYDDESGDARAEITLTGGWRMEIAYWANKNEFVFSRMVNVYYMAIKGDDVHNKKSR